jgi:hypothetical protein
VLRVLDLASGVMAPTLTYKVREWRYVPAGPECPYDGELTIILQRALRRERRDGSLGAARKLEQDTYAVYELAEECGPAARVFLLENLTEPDEYGPLKCVVGGAVETCSCEMGRVDSRRVEPTGCKHRSAIRALIEAGVI